MRVSLLLIAFAVSSCTQFAEHEPLRGRNVPAVIYYDFNRDGRVDYEHHTPRGAGGSDLEWARNDVDYDGYYDEHIGYGGTIRIVDRIHMRVPKIDFAEPKLEDSVELSNA